MKEVMPITRIKHPEPENKYHRKEWYKKEREKLRKVADEIGRSAQRRNSYGLPKRADPVPELRDSDE